ncbi:MAG: DMT family transporter [Pseudomonadota bacterium]
MAETGGRDARFGIFCVLGAWICFSTQDAVIKWISDDYALHQITLTRASIGMLFTLFVFMPREGGWACIRTNQLTLQLVRAILIVFSNFFFFTSIVVISLGEAMSIFFVSPLLITLLSVVFLRETVGWRRWIAVAIGFAGVLVILRPGTPEFQWVTVFPVLAALCYASAQIIARHLKDSESASTLAFYIQIVFVVFSLMVGLTVGDGRYAAQDHPSMAFLLRPWIWPHGEDLWWFLFIGVLSGIGAYLISQGYRLCEAGLAAPFEYIALPLSVMWSILLWQQWPDAWSWVGIVLIGGAGLYVFYRETHRNQVIAARRPQSRHR